jgi:hypothetical protein
MSNDNGGPAFPMPPGPEPRVNETTHFNEGMSLRDWFAGMAIDVVAKDYFREVEGYNFAHIARNCYAFADNMIAEKAKEKQS